MNKEPFFFPTGRRGGSTLPLDRDVGYMNLEASAKPRVFIRYANSHARAPEPGITPDPAEGVNRNQKAES